MPAVTLSRRVLRSGLSLLCSAWAYAIAFVLGFAGPLIVPALPVHAAGTQLYLSSAAGAISPNTTFAVVVRINTGGEVINAVQANFSYPAELLDFVSIDDSNSAFKTEAPSTGGNGLVSIARGQIGGVNGDALLATVTFRSKAASGTASIVFTTDTQALRNSDNTDALSGTTGTAYNLQSGAGSPTPNNKPPVIAPGPGAMPSANATPPASKTSPAGPNGADAVTPPAGTIATGSDDVVNGQAVSDETSDGSSLVLGIILAVAGLAAVAIAIVYKTRRPSPMVLPAMGLAPYGPPMASAPYVPQILRGTAPIALAPTQTPVSLQTPPLNSNPNLFPAPVPNPAMSQTPAPQYQQEQGYEHSNGHGYGYNPVSQPVAMMSNNNSNTLSRPQIRPSRYRSSPSAGFVQPVIIRPTQPPQSSAYGAQPQANGQSPSSYTAAPPQNPPTMSGY